MSNHNNLEQFFKHNLEQFSDEPSDKVWEVIAPRLPQQVAKVPTYQILMPFLVMCLLVICGFTMYNNTQLMREKEILSSKLERINESKIASDNYINENECIASCIANEDIMIFDQEPLM